MSISGPTGVHFKCSLVRSFPPILMAPYQGVGRALVYRGTQYWVGIVPADLVNLLLFYEFEADAGLWMPPIRWV